MTARPLPLVAALLILAVPSVRAQHAGPAPRPDARGGGGMMMDHAMMARMDSMDARLDSLAGVMNRAKGAGRVDAMAGILTMLVSHHREMRREMHRSMMERGMKRDGSDCGMNRGAGPDSSRAEQHQH